MIKIIAGAIDAGKSTTIKEMYQADPSGDGFVCQKIFNQDNKHIGYEFVRLKTGERIPFMVKDKYYDGDSRYTGEIGPYHYSNGAFKEVLEVIKELINNKVEPIYLDEIGRLELSKKGHDEAFRLIHKSHLDAVICVRDVFVRQVINHYRLEDYHVLGVNKK